MVNSAMDWLQPLLVIFLLGLLLFVLLRQSMELSRSASAGRAVKAYTLEACKDKVERREFREGDYVGLVTGNCEEGVKRVIGIYVEEVQEPQRRA
ncbi:MAG: hypothetical protein NZ902_01415 [Acidilobaceae archaeon]|nr:hypothetical protein [Acidilobaceae archaeon]MCX8165482.1 hypothetical protein [Acidilobaceae archaeon]MDW7973909.1 hypothetical protein [Sulfolobales archaeon]